jgi:hypothetical protein
MIRKSLSELLRDENHMPGIVGIVDAVLRNEDGSIADHRHQKNMITDFFRIFFVYFNSGGQISQNYVFLNQNTEAMHPKRTAMRNLLPGTFANSVSPIIDGDNRIWTYSTVFTAPPSTRIFQTIGLAKSTNTDTQNNVKAGPQGIFAATVLSSQVTQTTSQTLEINYRLAFQRN